MKIVKNKKPSNIESKELQDVFMRFHHKFVTYLRKEAENLHFTISQLDILRFVVEKKNPTMKNIVTHLDITAPSATSIIENLYEKKLVNREIDTKDRRGVRIYPTEKTLKLFSKFKDIKAGVVNEILLPLTLEDKKQLTNILKKII